MNDRYLFKAKRKNWKELQKEEWWVAGYYVFCRKHHYILPVVSETLGYDERYDEWIEIDESTLCQCTGLKDKNGTLIWENDVVKMDGILYLCYWDDCNVEYSLKNKEESFGVGYFAPYLLEVVDNNFDNPDFVEVER